MTKAGLGLICAFALVVGFSELRADDAPGVAAANATPGAQVSETTGNEILGIPTRNLYLNLSSTFHGPSVGSPSAQSIDRNGNPQSLGLYFDSELTPAYMVTEDIGVGATVPFFLLPVKGGDFIMGDAGGKFFHRHLIHVGGLNLSANLLIQAPTSTDSQNRGMSVGFKSTPTLSYVVPDSRFSFGSRSEFKWYAGVEAGKTFKLYAAPFVNYQLVSNLSATVTYEMEAHHDVNTTGYFNFTSYQTDLEPGFIWNVTPKVLVNPFVQLFTGNKVTFDTTALGVYINATVL